MRVYFRVYEIDGVGYDNNGYQNKPTQDTNTIFGTSNINRSQLIFKNINLLSILGRTEFYNNGRTPARPTRAGTEPRNDTFNIKVVEVRAINSNGNNVIDYDSPPQLRTSNIVMSGLNFYNGKRENVLTQFTNFNPNEELVFENAFFHRADLEDFRHFYEYGRNNTGGTTLDFYRLMEQESSTTTSLANVGNSLTRFRVNSTTITQLNNKIMRGSYSSRNGALFAMFVQDAGDGSLPSRVTQLNNNVTITILPENNQWFQRRYTDNVNEDDNNNELTAYIPSSHIVDLTFELRDILTDRLQPVIEEPNGKVYPSIEIVLDIY